MTEPFPTARRTPPPGRSILGRISIILTLVGAAIVLTLIAIGRLPGLGDVLWYAVIAMPFAGILALIGLLLGIVGMATGPRRNESTLAPLIGIVLAVVAMVSVALVFLG